ncbi:LysR family transcriptional regulator [Roseovarius sp. SCSIO 43702]|uniref:LysR family transcriptional regulator n=1 Tax=Roseovarius sp. SCSIO 43702 TaxID=2823043 RepID=UPI002175BB63|nr:LysR substrate-binding domain-containing protein [Roseovarius sp. SCSIO 43702]
MRLTLRQLEVFNALFDAGSVSRAADRLNLSQPAVSVALGKLEVDIGFRLFHRDRGFFAPTSEALLLRDEVQQGVAALARVEERAREIRKGGVGSIIVASNGAMAYSLLPRVMAEFQRDHPETRIELRVHSSRRVAAWVGSRQIDIGLIDAPVPAAGLEAELVQMACVVIMRADDPLAACKEVGPSNIAERAFIAVTGDHQVDRQVAHLMAQHGAELSYRASSYFYAIGRALVAAGGGIAIIDPVNGTAELGDGVVARPFRPTVVHDLAVIRPKGQPMGLAAERFHARLRAALTPYRMGGGAGQALDAGLRGAATPSWS